MFYAWTIGEHFSVCIADDFVCVLTPAGWSIYDASQARRDWGSETGDDGRRDAMDAVRRLKAAAPGATR